jgi:hypothetical protein
MMATLNSVPAAGTFAVYAGDDFSVQFTLLDKPRAQGGVPQDLSDWTFTAEWRVRASDEAETTFAVDQSGANVGEVILSLTPAQTRAMDGSGIFDLQGVAGDGTVQTFLTGRTIWSPDVTRA